MHLPGLVLRGYAAAQAPLGDPQASSSGVSTPLFASLERCARLVDIAYCVGNTATGIAPPFSCVSRCRDFPEMRLVTTWNTGVLSMRDNCGYIAVDKTAREIVVAFRGTYSITNTVVDLSTIPQEYVPYKPGEGLRGHPRRRGLLGRLGRLVGGLWGRRHAHVEASDSEDSGGSDGGDPPAGPDIPPCHNCTVHSGFLASWESARALVLPAVAEARESDGPDGPPLHVHLVGHSLGGAVAALAALEMKAVLGWDGVRVTTFGEPRIGNKGLATYLEEVFEIESASGAKTSEAAAEDQPYRRITHKNDPVPLLPLADWGYQSHAGEIYIEKADLPPGPGDLRVCRGREDPGCISEDGESMLGSENRNRNEQRAPDEKGNDQRQGQGRFVEQSPRLKPWELFFAHRDYFWRLGLCVPGGDPADWGRERYNYTDEL